MVRELHLMEAFASQPFTTPEEFHENPMKMTHPSCHSSSWSSHSFALGVDWSAWLARSPAWPRGRDDWHPGDLSRAATRAGHLKDR